MQIKMNDKPSATKKYRKKTLIIIIMLVLLVMAMAIIWKIKAIESFINLITTNKQTATIQLNTPSVKEDQTLEQIKSLLAYYDNNLGSSMGDLHTQIMQLSSNQNQLNQIVANKMEAMKIDKNYVKQDFIIKYNLLEALKSSLPFKNQLNVFMSQYGYMLSTVDSNTLSEISDHNNLTSDNLAQKLLDLQPEIIKESFKHKTGMVNQFLYLISKFIVVFKYRGFNDNDISQSNSKIVYQVAAYLMSNQPELANNIFTHSTLSNYSSLTDWHQQLENRVILNKIYKKLLQHFVS